MFAVFCRQAMYGMNSVGVHVTPVVKLLFTQVNLLN